MNKNKNHPIKGIRFFLPIFLSLFSVSFCVYGSEEKENDVSIDIVHPCTDYGFKRAFHDPHVACGFLNTILDLKDQNIITNVRFLDKELPSHEALGRDFIVDILCETQDNRRFLVEMQNDFRADYATKAFTEFCRLIAHWDAETIRQEVTEESRKRARASETYDGTKEFWKDIKTAIVLVVTNKRFPATQHKVLFPGQVLMEPEIINSYRMMHESHAGRFLGDLDARVVLVMLGNFNKSESDLTSSLDRWLYAFKDENLASGVSRIPTYKHIENIHSVEGDDANLTSFYHTLNKRVVFMTGDLEKFEKNIAEVNMALDTLKAKERMEGREEGVQREKRSTVHQMLLAECSVDLIAKVTKLSEAEINLLRDHAVSASTTSSSSSSSYLSAFASSSSSASQFSEGKK